jgi:hypothetical protein
MPTSSSDSFTLHGFWAVIERAWDNMDEIHARADILDIFLLATDDVYTAHPNYNPDIDILRDITEDLSLLLPLVCINLGRIISEFNERQRTRFFHALEAAIGSLGLWDGEEAHLTSENTRCIRTRCWVVLMGREIYHSFRANALTHAYLDYVQSREMYSLAQTLFFEIGKASKAQKRKLL